MTNSKENVNPLVTERINPGEKCEFMHWSKKFGLTENQLKKVMQKAGTSANAVKSMIKR